MTLLVLWIGVFFLLLVLGDDLRKGAGQFFVLIVIFLNTLLLRDLYDAIFLSIRPGLVDISLWCVVLMLNSFAIIQFFEESPGLLLIFWLPGIAVVLMRAIYHRLPQ